MKGNRIHLEKAVNGSVTECGKQLGDSIQLAFREGSLFFSLPSIERVKPDCICMSCLSKQSPAIAALVKSRKAIKVQLNSPPVTKESIPAPSKPIKPKCLTNKRRNCPNELNCQDCDDAFSLLPPDHAVYKALKKQSNKKPRKPIARKPIAAPVIEKKKARKALPPTVKQSIEQTAKQLIDAVIPPIPKSNKGKVRELRKTNQLKVVNPPVAAQFSKPDTQQVIEVKSTEVANQELSDKIRAQYVCRHMGIGNQNQWGILHRVSDTKTEMIYGPADYQSAFAFMNARMVEDLKKQSK